MEDVDRFSKQTSFLRYYSPGIWVAARRQRPLHALENAKAIRYTLSENAKTGRLPENFASLIHQGVSYYTKKLRHFKTQKSQSITMLYLHVKINPSVVNYRKQLEIRSDFSKIWIFLPKRLAAWLKIISYGLRSS